MKTTGNIALILMLTVAVSGCRKTIMPCPEFEQVIGFRTEVAETKAGATFLDRTYFTTPENTFYVYSTYSVPSPVNPELTVSADILSREVVTATSGANGIEWSYPDLQYWHKTGEYDFRALVLPAAKLGQIVSSSNALNLALRYSMLTDDYDLLAAYKHRSMELWGNSLDDMEYVNLGFHHATSAITFAFSAGEHSKIYTLKSLVLKNIVVDGVFLYADKNDSNKTNDQLNWNQIMTNSWYLGNNEENYVRADEVYNWNGSVVIPNEYKDFTAFDYHCVIPQAIATSTDKKPAVTFVVNVKDNQADEGRDVTTTLPLPETQPWVAGTKITYRIKVQPNTADITVYTVPWDESKAVVEDIYL